MGDLKDEIIEDAGGAPDLELREEGRREVENLLAGWGRNIDEMGGFGIEITPDRTQ